MLTRNRLGAAALLGAIAAAGAAAAQPHPVMGRGFDLDFAAIDTNGDGALDRDELRAFAAARIAGIDTNGDGMIDRAEIVAVFPDPAGGLWNPFGRARGEHMADRMLERMDAAEAGQVAAADVAERRMNALLARIDTDHDGTISQAEAEAAQKRGPRGRHDGPRGERGDGPHHRDHRGDTPRP